MSVKRPPAPPPNIDGYRYVRLLGSGGFSDVYLYEQDRPRRRVAVKVLLSGLRTEDARRRFESEANLMAQLSTHPFIVTIYEANLTADGHSYLAMEYCSRPSLDARYRKGPLGVDEVLTLGIQVASAVETAHRAGIAHRDIKPANILVTDYNRPALTDFGISSSGNDAADSDVGMSIPWSPPESFKGDAGNGTRGDIWALGATVYTLLAGRSPFLQPGGNNSQRELMDRIAHAPLPPLGRADVPASLELALATAMAKSPGSRFKSAHAFALSLQRVQAELNLSVTPFEVLEEAPSAGAGEADDGEATRVRGIVSIDPAAAAPSAGSVFPERTERFPARQDGRRLELEPEASTVLRDSAADQWTESGSGARRRPWTWVAGAVAAVAVAAGAIFVLNRPAPEAAVPDAPVSRAPANALEGLSGNVVPPEELDGRVEGSEAVFSWTNPDPRDDDLFIWTPVTALGQGEPERTGEPKAVLPLAENDRTCIEVVVVRANGRASDPVRGCADE
ncbi:serine/threonine-protein kinase [Arthrobacter sulfonylureivorans]|uniref:serine/threonine-protein kinase n=1 Tax=Arthrobacter sulfonylureivorans TaxID=2486855 RepID=UPI0039E67FCB